MITRPSTSRWLRPDTLAAGVMIVFAAAVLQRVLGFGRSVLFCRLLEPAELGEWDLALGFLMLAAPVAVLSLPGCFSRYVEHYRLKGQLRMFLRRTLSVIGVLVVLATLAMVMGRDQVSQVVFGRPDRGLLVVCCGLALLALVGQNVAVELFSALRLQRVAAGLGMLHAVVFLSLGAMLLLSWQRSAMAAVIAFAAASLASVIAALIWWCVAAPQARPAEATPEGGFWPKVLNFTIWIWVTNALSNLFGLADRYMLLHHAQLSVEQALAAVGQYHSARLVPLLLITAAAMLANVITPYLSSDWERGRRHMVMSRIRLLLKFTGLGLAWCSVLTLLLAPWLFGVAFSGKFGGGQEVLPWTLICGVWTSLIVVAQLYLICSETPRSVSIAFAVGLAVNIVCNLWLLPRFGLLGAALSSCAAHLVVLVAVGCLAHWRGMQFDRGTLFVMALPLSLGLGLWPATAIVAVASLWAWLGRGLVTEEERRELSIACGQQLAAWRSAKGRAFGKRTPLTVNVTEGNA